MTKVLKMSLLGPLQLTLDDEPLHNLVSAKGQALLCYLAVNGRSHSRQAIAGLLWGDLPEADARRNLRGVLMKLRQVVAPYLEITHQAIAFNDQSPHWLDVQAFSQQVAAANMESWQTAIELYRGDFLEDFHLRDALDFTAWVQQQQMRLRQQAITTFDKLIDLHIENKTYEKGVQLSQRLLALDNVREISHQYAMRLFALQGERGRALEQYVLCMRLLQEELGVEVSTETAVLADTIRSGKLHLERLHEPQVLVPPKPTFSRELSKKETAVSPQFIAGPPISQPAHFFGRETILKRLFNLLRTRPLQNAAIIGPRRSGKTSLLHYLKNISTASPAKLRPNQRRDWLIQPQQYHWVFVDFQDPRLGSCSGLLRYILTQLNFPVPDVCDIDQFMDVMVDHLYQPSIILFDEIGVALERYPELDDAFWESMRSLATNQVDGNLGFVLTSHAQPYELAQHSGLGSPFFNIFGYTAVLGPFTDAEARSLIATSPTPIPEQDIAWMIAESGNWPLLLQILCRERTLSLEEGETGDQWRADALMQLQPFIKLKDAT
ncbi:MAG: hypothetical protein DWQ04_18850 [Chloroflexi bacterium]|nr:MAG: hypothetical protein DWQ04_18850 [Chloroflexota bacterium]